MTKLDEITLDSNADIEEVNSNFEKTDDLLICDYVKNSLAQLNTDLPPSVTYEHKRCRLRIDNSLRKCELNDDGTTYSWQADGGGGGSGGSIVNITTTDSDLYGKSLSLYRISGSTQTLLKTGTISNSGSCTLINILDTGTMKIVVQNNLARKYFTINNYSAYYVTIKGEGEYGFRIKKTETNPSTRVEYIDDTDNYLSTPAKMNYVSGAFEYGDWEDFCNNESKSVMLKYDGTVDYELNEDDNTLKKDGTGSDITNVNYQGNAMVGFKKLYIKTYEETINGVVYQYWRASTTERTGYQAYAHTNYGGDIVEYFYYAKYKGYNYNNKIRSISGFRPTSSISGGASTEFTYCRANNLDISKKLWDMIPISQWLFIQGISILISKNCNSQEAFGNGNIYYSGSGEAANLCNTGTLDKKGKFWGSNSSTTHVDVKLWGVEGLYANRWERCAGWINANGTQKIKMTRGTEDGSVATDYNLDGTGYITINNATPSGTNGGYISDTIMTEYGLIPKTAGGSATTYYCDGLWFNNSQNNFGLVGGDCHYGLLCGVGCVDLNNLASHVHWYVGVSLSCIPETTT